MKSIKDYYLYIPILILGAYLIFRLINQSQIIFTFPLDKYNDWSSYMAQLHFLKECGFHNFCSYWYNGFINFQINQPGWYFFIYPLYLIIKNVQLTAYLSLIITLALSLGALYLNRKKLQLSKTKVLALFLFFFGNAVAIGNFIRVGKIHELFGWFNLIVIFIFILIYKDKKIDKKFLFIVPFYFFAVLSHQNSAIIASLAILGLFLTKKIKENVLIIISVLITIIATSFWWIDYVKNFFSTTSTTIIVGNSLMTISKATLNDNLTAIIVPLAFFIVLYFYLKSRKKEIIFFLPQTILAFLILTRLIIFIPVINHVYPDSYNLFLLFFTIFMLFKIDFDIIKKYRQALFFGLILISILSVSLSIINTPLFISHTQVEKDTISILPEIKDKFVIIGTYSRRTSYPNAYYAYAAIYHNLSTSGGWYPSMVNGEYIDKLESLNTLIKNKECDLLKKELTELNTSEVITYDENCKFLEDCGFNKKIDKPRVCLYNLK